jgi:hypothetical protein
MTLTPHIPTIDQLLNFQAWDQSLGMALAFVLAGLIGAYVVVTLVFAGFMRSSYKENGTWVVVNLLIGFVASFYVLELTGSWLTGCAVAVVCFVVLRIVRQEYGG